MSGMATVFSFARSGGARLMTRRVRRMGTAAHRRDLRGFRASTSRFPISDILGWVTKAMIKILTISLGLRDVDLLGITVSGEIIAVGICFVITVAYSAGAGMWAVLWTDLVQFVIKMTAVIILAIYSVRAVGGMDKLKAGLNTHFGSAEASTSVLPIKMTENGLEAYAWMPRLRAPRLPFPCSGGAAWYPGAEPARLLCCAADFSAKTERDGVLATLFFQVAHYAIRPWPWIVPVLLHRAAVPQGIGPTHDRKERTCKPSSTTAIPVAGRHAGGIRRRLHVNGRHAAQLGASYLVNDFTSASS